MSLFRGWWRGCIRKSTRSGATLTELMIATAVMTIGVVGLTGSFINVQKGIQFAKNKTLASNLAQEKIQILTQKNYYEVLVSPAANFRVDVVPNVTYDTVYFPPETILEGGVTYTRYTYVQVVTEDPGTGAIVIEPPQTPDTGLRLITVSVVWSVGGNPQQLTVNTVLTNPSSVMAISVVQGTIRDASTGTPIAGAVANMAENMGWRATTPANGQFSINASIGNFTLIASAQGYYTQFKPISIPANSVVTQNFDLVSKGSGTVTGTVWMNPNIVISQVVVDTYTWCISSGGVLSQQDVEYVELFNPTTSPVYIGNTGDYYNTNMYSLWYMPNGGAGAYQWPSDGPNYFNIQYATTTVPAGGYFLFSNAPTFLINGQWVSADAVFHGSSQYPHFMSAAGNVSLPAYVAWAHYPGGPTIDSVGWNNATTAPSSYWVPTLSTVTIPNYAGNNGIGSPKGNQVVRISSPGASGFDMTNYGHAYNSFNNQQDLLYPNGTFAGLPYTPHRTSSGSFTIVAGVPAVGAIITANDGLSVSATAYAVGSPMHADFTLVNVGTTPASQPWIVRITSGQYTLENDTVTMSSPGWIYKFPSSTTFLRSPSMQGFIAGTVTDLLGNPISAPVAIPVSAAGVTQNANTGNGRYWLRVSSGSFNVTANANAINSNYVSVSSLSVTVRRGIVTNNVNFVLTQGGRISGFVTRDGINPLPGVTVAMLDSNGYARDTQVSDATGHFTTLIIATGTYNVTPQLDSLAASTPTSTAVALAAGQSAFSSTFTITGALGTVSGNVTSGGQPISTGVLVVVTTVTLAGSPPAPPAISSNSLSGASYYISSSREDGSYSVDVRQSTAPAYNVYGFYTSVAPNGAVTIQSRTLSNVGVLAGQTVAGQNLAW